MVHERSCLLTLIPKGHSSRFALLHSDHNSNASEANKNVTIEECMLIFIKVFWNQTS